MTPVHNVDEVYRYLTSLRGPDGDGEPDVIALFTVALVERERIDWIAHIIDQTLPPPNADEVEAWYFGKSESYFADKMRKGEASFSAFARAYLKDDMANMREAAVREATKDLEDDIRSSRREIITHVTDRTSSKGWLVNISSGLISNFAFTLIAVVLTYAAVNKVSIADTLAELFGFFFRGGK